MNTIGFPYLNLYFDINPVAFKIMGKEVYWYGILIALGFLLAATYVFKRAKKFDLTSDNMLDVLIYATPSAIIGARLYYVLFNFDVYRGDFTRVFYVWEGGLAIYGAVIFAFLATVIVAKLKKLSTLNILDLGVLGLLIGQAVGRWGNFVNAEAYGSKTNSIFAMMIPNGSFVHPTFLYESLWCILGFLLLHFVSNKRKFKGEILLLYIAWYGLGRGFIEGLREDSLYLFNTTIRVSQVLAFASFFVSVILLLIFFFKKPKISENNIEVKDEESTEELKEEINELDSLDLNIQEQEEELKTEGENKNVDNN